MLLVDIILTVRAKPIAEQEFYCEIVIVLSGNYLFLKPKRTLRVFSVVSKMIKNENLKERLQYRIMTQKKNSMKMARNFVRKSVIFESLVRVPVTVIWPKLWIISWRQVPMYLVKFLGKTTNIFVYFPNFPPIFALKISYKIRTDGSSPITKDSGDIFSLFSLVFSPSPSVHLHLYGFFFKYKRRTSIYEYILSQKEGM